MDASSRPTAPGTQDQPGPESPQVSDGRDAAGTDEAESLDEDAAVIGSERAGRRRFGIVTVAVALVVGLVLGYAVGWLVPRLTTPGDDSVEAGFARDMIFHHTQAVEMGLVGFQKASNPDVQRIAVDIVGTQQGEIGMMHAWLADWGVDPTGSQPAMAWMPAGSHGAHMSAGGLMPGMASADEMTRLREAQGTQTDIMFLQLMIRHHLGGVHMIDAVLKVSDQEEVRRAAQIMRNTQNTELNNLTKLLTGMGASPLPTN